MNYLKHILFGLLAISIASCGGDDDDDVKKQHEAETIQLGFLEREHMVEVPEALSSSQDPFAAIAASYIVQANSITNYFTYFDFPEGTPMTRDRIVASNARTHVGKYHVYTWNTGQGFAAYQIGEYDNHYTFESFLRNNPADEWLMLISGEERKDRSKDFLKVYNLFDGSNPSQIVYRYDWTRIADIFHFTYTSSFNKVEIEVNEKTQVGRLQYLEEDKIRMEINWLSNGGGNWKMFHADGSLEDEGIWTN